MINKKSYTVKLLILCWLMIFNKNDFVVIFYTTLAWFENNQIQEITKIASVLVIGENLKFYE